MLDFVNINRDISNFSMTRGDTLAFGFEINGLNGQEIDNAHFTIKNNKNSITPVLQLSYGDGITSDGNGLYKVRARPELTANLEPNTYRYDLEVEVGNDKFTIMDGKITIKKGVTE